MSVRKYSLALAAAMKEETQTFFNDLVRGSTADRVRQTIYYPSMPEKMPLLLGLLRRYDAKRTMVFVNTKRMAERLEDVQRFFST